MTFINFIDYIQKIRQKEDAAGQKKVIKPKSPIQPQESEGHSPKAPTHLKLKFIHSNSRV